MSLAEFQAPPPREGATAPFDGRKAFLWLPGREESRSLFELAVISLICTSFFLFAGEVSFPGGADHFTYWAEAIAEGKIISLHFTQRAVGYPVLILLTGWPWTDSFIVLFIVQAGFAFAMPLLVFQMLKRTSIIVAYLSSILVMLSLLPYQLMKFIHHDQMHVFLLVLTATFAVLFLQSGRDRFLYLATLSAIACTLTRPISILLLPILLVASFYINYCLGRFAKKPVFNIFLPYILSLAMFVVASIGNEMHRRAIFGLSAGMKEPSYTGAQLFYSPYMNSREFGVEISPELGPNTAKLFEKLRSRLGEDPLQSEVFRSYLSDRPDATEFINTQLLGYSTDEFVDRFFKHPNAVYFHMLTYDYDTDDELSSALLGSALEIAAENPLYVIRYTLRHFLNFLFSPGKGHSMWNTLPIHQQGQAFQLSYHISGNSSTALPARTYQEISYSAASASWFMAYAIQVADNHYTGWYLAISSWTVVFMLFGFAVSLLASLALMSKTLGTRIVDTMPRLQFWLPASIIPTLLVLYHGAVVSMTAEPLFRYHEMVLMLQITAAGAGCVIAWELVSGLLAMRRAAAAPPPSNLLAYGRDARLDPWATWILFGGASLYCFAAYAIFLASSWN